MLAMLDDNEILWNHYHQLTEEIRSLDTLNYQIIGVVVVGAASLVAAAFNRNSLEDRSWILLSIFALIIPGIRFLGSTRGRMWNLATYLEIFIEPELEIVKWQERLNKRAPVKRNFQMLDVDFHLMSLLAIAAGFLIVTTCFWMPSNEAWSFGVGAVALTSLSLILAFRAITKFARCGKAHRDNQEGWQALKKVEKNAVNADPGYGE